MDVSLSKLKSLPDYFSMWLKTMRFWYSSHVWAILPTLTLETNKEPKHFYIYIFFVKSLPN